MFCCARCGDKVDELWATIEMWSRAGNLQALDLCQSCTQVAYAFVLNRPLRKGREMTVMWTMPLDNPEDIDDAEHHAMCHCHECDPDFHMELMRDARMDEAS